VVGQLFELCAGCQQTAVGLCCPDVQNVAAPDANFKTEHKKMVLLTPHTGTAFDKDNGKVWIQVKQLTVNVPAWTYVAPFKEKRHEEVH
jgi:hypothetical protein